MALELKGTARLNELDVDKTGAGQDDQELKVTYKFGMVCGAGVLAHFDPALKSYLFNPQTAEPRFPAMKPVAWKGSSRDMDLDLGGVKLCRVLVGNYSFEPLAGERLALRFVATCHPTEQQLAESSRLLKTEVEIALSRGGQLGLDMDDDGPHQVTAPAPDLAPLKQALNTLEVKLNGWPQPQADGTYKPGESINYADERLHVACAATINLVQIDENLWASAARLVLPDTDEIFGFDGLIRQGGTQAVSRAWAIDQQAQGINQHVVAWNKANKRAAAAKRQAVAALEKWLSGLLVGGAPASLKDDAPTKKPAGKTKSSAKK